MFKHLFKLIWNKKKQNSLLIAEILLSFMVMFAVFTFGVNSYRNYVTPMGIDYEHVWVINYNNSLKTTSSDSLALFYESLLRNIKSMPKVIDAGYSSNNVPFSSSHSSSGIKYDGEEFDRVNQFTVDDNYTNTLGAKMIEGRWYNKEDKAGKQRLTVINNSLKEKLFGNTTALGKYLTYGDDKAKIKIIGVVNDIKFDGDYQVAGPSMYGRADTSAYHWLSRILVKVSPDADAAFEGRLYKMMANTLKNSNIEIEHLDNKLTAYNKFTLVPLIILSIVAAFLIINVALGIFGVLWYNINKRRGEIGLRRAIGASGSSVSSQLVTEALILTTLSIIAGTFFAVQFPLLNVFDLPAGVYLTAIGLAIGFIYLVVIACSLYPGNQAAAIYPAVALHEE
ncbi:FtsX-like permease family protein [Pedobacter sp. HMF7647]|uniref:FtsX-like permease family protein n=1 Tax=Hufsiella arboris TaxID=2695275 RepID=A0A7K1Y9K0_9SPHI|nr:ABC transporter permease [Hufsiella arboris]MXV51266.1 FtsX-like permease family protein [Hufsiella arboris]